MSEGAETMDVKQIMELLPHRYPFLLVDRVTSIVPHESVECIKNVSFNEPFFQGHFPGLPVMPGVLQVEALAQAGGVLVLKSMPELIEGNVFMFTGINKVKFRKPVVPGDQLVLRLTEFKKKLPIFKMKGEALVDGKVVCQCELTAAMVKKEEL